VSANDFLNTDGTLIILVPKTAIVLLAGSTARFNAHREGWNGDLERDLAIKALGGETGFVAANREAVKLVQLHWHQITGKA
jgi:hypothetical protein